MRPMQQFTEHTGEERYEVKLTYTPEEKGEIAKLTPDGQIVVEVFYLVYTRYVGGEWRRYTNGRHGSRAEGNEKIENGRGAVGAYRSRQVFTSTLGEVCKWADHLPGLRQAISDVELLLPE